jgi:hypothetical protein
MVFGIKYGGANSSKKGRNEMIFLPITQLQLMLSMGIAEIFLLSDPNYTVTIGSENYFSLAVGAFIAGIFILVVIAIRVGSTVKFKETQKEKIIVKQN